MNAACSHFLYRSAELWSAWMWPMTWHVTVLVLLLTALTSLLGRQPARLRYLLWTLVLVRLCLPPATSFPTSWGWWFDFSPAPPTEISAWSSISSRSPVPAEITTATVPTVPASLPLFLLWCGVLAVRWGMLTTGWLQVRSWVRRAHPVPRPELFDLLLRVKLRLGYDGEVRLLNSESCATPLVVGWRHPAILLPRAVLESFSTAELEAVLSHELSHLRRGDSLLRMIQSCLGCLYFFHPAVWWSWSQLNRLREDACDESTVMALSGKRKAYAAALVKASEILGYSQPVLSLGVLDSFRPVAERVRRILDPDFPVRDMDRWRVVLGYGAAALLFLPAAGREDSRAST